MIKEEIDGNIYVNPSNNVKFNRFSFEVNLVLSYPRSTNLLFGPLNVRTRYEFEIVTNRVLTTIFIMQYDNIYEIKENKKITT